MKLFDVIEVMPAEKPSFSKCTLQSRDIDTQVTNQIHDIQSRVRRITLDESEHEVGWIHGGLQILLHFTILYGIETDEESIDVVQRVFDRVGPISVDAVGLDYFDNDSSVLVVRLESAQLTAFHDEVKERLGVKEKYPEFKPHITVAYLNKRTRIKPFDFQPVSWEITEMDMTKPGGDMIKIKVNR